MTGTPSHRLKRHKRAVRLEVLARRDALGGDERANASAAIVRRVLALPELRSARTVMAFWAFGSEVDTGPLIERLHADGKRVILPRIEGREAVPVTFAPGDPMRRTAFGAREPTEGVVVGPEELDVIITPGVAFDRRGDRVGYGGGFYDRLFDRVRPDVPKVAVAFGLQVVPDVPTGPADRRVDMIVTEDEVIRCG